LLLFPQVFRQRFSQKGLLKKEKREKGGIKQPRIWRKSASYR
jgi:hypothetical protein